MTVLADRLRGLIGSSTAVAGRPPARHADPEVVAETLGGAWHEAGGHRYLVVDRSYGPGHRHGRFALADAMPEADGMWPMLDLLLASRVGSEGGERAGRPARLLFVDLETTGLAGGAGSYAFLVGCAWFDAGRLRVRQYFLSSFGAEAALLAGVTRLAEEATGVVTYNGKSFDLPLLDTRYVVNRMASPLGALPHVDLLHPARRLWREPDADRMEPGGSSCRLTALERSQCGFAREGDVPGFEIPGRYFDYVRSGDARPLEAVLEHNRLDLISLALLTGMVAQKLAAGAASAATAREGVGLGRLLERGGLVGDARACYARAGDLPGDAVTRAEALHALATSWRRARAYDAAAEAWARLLAVDGCPLRLAHEASEALAVYHEHRRRDPHTARRFALGSLRLDVSEGRRQSVHYRLARLERKLGSGEAAAQPPLLLA